MAIKFTCPQCQAAMTVSDGLAGKRGKCSKCQAPVIVPQANGVTPAPAPKPAAAPPAARAPASKVVAPAPPPPKAPAPPAAPARPPAPKPAVKRNGPAATPPPVSPPPAPPPAPQVPEVDYGDVEATAAALFSDEVKKEEPGEVKTIEFECEYCGEKQQMDVALAGKKAPCTNRECGRIIKVPELKKREKADWRGNDARLPGGAKRPDQPVLEGAWSTGQATQASLQSLEEAGAIPEVAEPRTIVQKVRPWVFAAAGIGVVVLGVVMVMGWLHRTREQRAVKRVLDYAASPAAVQQVGVEGQAALFVGTGTYYQRAGQPEEARKQFSKALNGLAGTTGNERDCFLGQFALAQVELGGSQIEIDEKRALKWGDAQAGVRATLTAIAAPEPRLEALRAVAHRLLARGQVERVLPLAAQVYPTPGEERAEALAMVGAVLLSAGKAKEAKEALDQALTVYSGKEKRPLRVAVVGLGVALDRRKELPKPGKGLEEAQTERVGQAEGLARQGQWDQAREIAGKDDAEGRFLAFMALADAALDAKTDAKPDAEAALQALSAIGDQRKLSWPMLRLARVALSAGLPDQRVQELVATIPDPGVKTWGQFLVFRKRVEGSPRQPVPVEVADQVPANTLCYLLAREELAQHNARLDSKWEGIAQGWEGGAGAFGSLGVALALQGDKRSEGPR